MNLLFMHIPKTAGSSFRRALQAAEISLGIERCPTPADQYLDYETFLSQRQSLALRYHFIPGHYPFHAWESLLEHGRLTTLLREPLSRSVSHIKHQCRQEHEADPSQPGMNVNEFLRAPKNHLFLKSISSLMVKYFSYAGDPEAIHSDDDLSLKVALAHARQTRIGFADHLDEFLREILFDAFDAPLKRMEEIYSQRPPQRLLASDDPFSVQDVEADNLEKLAAINHLDLEFYNLLRSEHLD